MKKVQKPREEAHVTFTEDESDKDSQASENSESEKESVASESEKGSVESDEEDSHTEKESVESDQEDSESEKSSQSDEEKEEKSTSIFNKIYKFTTGLANNILNNGIEKVSDFLDVDMNDPNSENALKDSTQRISDMATIMEPIAKPILEKTAKNVGKLVGEAVDSAAKTAVLGARDVIETIPGASLAMLANDATKLVQTGVHAASKMSEEVSDTVSKLNEAVDRSTRFRSSDLINRRKKSVKTTNEPLKDGELQNGGKTKRKYQKRNRHAATRKDRAEDVKTRVQKNINKYMPRTKKKKIDKSNL